MDKRQGRHEDAGGCNHIVDGTAKGTADAYHHHGWAHHQRTVHRETDSLAHAVGTGTERGGRPAYRPHPVHTV